MNAKNEILNAIRRLSDGDIMKPIPTAAAGVRERAVLTELELLRKRLLSEKDRETEREKRFETTVASVVHDLKTPLAVLSGYAECLEDGLDDRDYPALLREKTAEMNDMVLNILAAAKEIDSETGERFVPERVTVGSFFQRELEKYRALAEKKNITYSYQNAPNVIARVDRAKLARLIQNLVTNAVKYTPDNGKIRIKFYIWQNRLCMEVADTGEGIEKKNLPFVFDKFFREDAARSSSNSGLGLFIAKEVAELHGGELEVRSKKGKGSRFTLRLPYDLEIQKKQRLFDRFPRIAKFAFVLAFDWFFCYVYRFSQFTKTRHVSTLVGAIFSMPLFVFFWFIDIASVAAYNKITFLAD